MDKNTIVLTMYGTGKTVNDFSITLLGNDSYRFGQNTAEDYCNNINELELKDDNWVYASIIKENQKIRLEKPIRYTDFGIISSLDDRAIKKLLQEISLWHFSLDTALISADKEILRAVFRNMTKGEVKEIIEKIENHASTPKEDIEKARKEIFEMIQHLEMTGKITVPKSGQDERN
jgi:flagellar motor switch protein FliG